MQQCKAGNAATIDGQYGRGVLRQAKLLHPNLTRDVLHMTSIQFETDWLARLRRTGAIKYTEPKLSLGICLP